MKEIKFYICKHCSNVAHKLTDSGVLLVCCGEKMSELTANTVDAAKEKHVPVVTRNGSAVTANAGSITHPMQTEHSIMWIAAVHGDRMDIKYLSPTDSPIADFTITEPEFTVYEYCNLHGLWMAQSN